MEENKDFLSKQIITYIGNKRKLLNEINNEILLIKSKLNKEKISTGDLFSGSGIVARLLKQHSSDLYVNDLEEYSYIINDCYLTNKEDFNEEQYLIYLFHIYDDIELNQIEGIITQNYAPKNDNNIQEGERVFYTHENAKLIDTIRTSIDKHIDKEEYKKFFIAPLLYEASVHVNTSGVFKGFYKSKDTKIGKFGGDGENALDRIKGKITQQKPIFSNFNANIHLYKEDINTLVDKLPEIDVVYLDPPYNQHPYGSNYFMLNTIINNKITGNLSKISGIPDNWNKSAYNKKNEALNAFNDLISKLKAKYIIISYNNEGFISYQEIIDLLSKYGNVKTKEIEYNTFRGSRNLQNRNKHVTEYLFILEKN